MLFSLYVLLSRPLLHAVGGNIYFKGSQLDKLSGRPEYDRDSLMIVRYPSAQAYLDMVSRRWFRWLGQLRKSALNDLVMGFSKRLDNGPRKTSNTLKYWGHNLYLVHQFQIDRKRFLAQQVELHEIAFKHNVRLFFSGSTEATVLNKNKETITNDPFFIDGIVLFESEDREALIALQKDERYKAFENSTSRTSMYIFGRQY